MGRKLAAADLQLLLLALLNEKPSHGYELIKALEERSAGFYSPSPGVIYPALSYLGDVGHATVESEGARKRYHITDEGRAYLEQHRATVDVILDGLARIGGKMAHVRHVFTGEPPPDRHGHERGRGRERDRSTHDPDSIRAAGRALKDALDQKRHAAPEESARVAAILRRAVAEILGEDSTQTKQL